jgi:predicted DNA binding protein
MAFFETRARVQHPCRFCDLSAAFPDVRMALWCNFTGEVLHVDADDPKMRDEVLEAVRTRLGFEAMFEEEPNSFTITRMCVCTREGSVTGVAERSGLWILHPITMHGGWETYRLISTGRDDVRAFVEGVSKLGKVEIVSHRVRERLAEVHNVDFYPAHLFDGLTDRQVRALLLAHEQGLLNIPSEVGMDEVARREGLARSTFGEHLRKAQQRLLSNAYPFLRLHSGAEGRGEARVAKAPTGSVEAK